jgi:hypothetical protein
MVVMIGTGHQGSFYVALHVLFFSLGSGYLEFVKIHWVFENVLSYAFVTDH